MQDKKDGYTYKTALSVFLNSKESYEYDLDHFDIAYLYTLANVQDLSIHVCKMKRTEFAIRARISERKIRSIEEKLSLLGIIMIKRVWKINWIILSKVIAKEPIQWNSTRKSTAQCASDTKKLSTISKKIDHLSTAQRANDKVIHSINGTACQRSTAQCASDQRHSVPTTIEIIEIEMLEKESGESASPPSTLSDFVPDKQHQTLCSRLGLSLSSQVERFKRLHHGRGDLCLAFEDWLKDSRDYKNKNNTNSVQSSASTSGIQFWGPGHPGWESLHSNRKIVSPVN